MQLVWYFWVVLGLFAHINCCKAIIEFGKLTNSSSWESDFNSSSSYLSNSEGRSKIGSLELHLNPFDPISRMVLKLWNHLFSEEDGKLRFLLQPNTTTTTTTPKPFTHKYVETDTSVLPPYNPHITSRPTEVPTQTSNNNIEKDSVDTSAETLSLQIIENTASNQNNQIIETKASAKNFTEEQSLASESTTDSTSAYEDPISSESVGETGSTTSAPENPTESPPPDTYPGSSSLTPFPRPPFSSRPGLTRPPLTNNIHRPPPPLDIRQKQTLMGTISPPIPTINSQISAYTSMENYMPYDRYANLVTPHQLDTLAVPSDNVPISVAKPIVKQTNTTSKTENTRVGQFERHNDTRNEKYEFFSTATKEGALVRFGDEGQSPPVHIYVPPNLSLFLNPIHQNDKEDPIGFIGENNTASGWNANPRRNSSTNGNSSGEGEEGMWTSEGTQFILREVLGSKNVDGWSSSLFEDNSQWQYNPSDFTYPRFAYEYGDYEMADSNSSEQLWMNFGSSWPEKFANGSGWRWSPPKYSRVL